MQDKKNTIKLIIIAIIIFMVSCLVWYLPIKYKGHAPIPADRSLVLARNLHFSGVAAVENKMGAYVNSAQVTKSSVPWSGANRLSYLAYNKIFDIFGFSTQLPTYVAIILFALANSILFLLITYLFGLAPGLIFSALSIFTPVIWQGALIPGYYDWAVLFFVIGFSFYWLKKRQSWIFLFMAGIFFSLAILSRNAFFISVGAIGLFELINKKSLKRAIVLGLPIFLMVILPFVISHFQGGPLYQNLDTYGNYGHCFPDPYTYHFDKQNHIDSIAGQAQGDVLACLGQYDHQISASQHIATIFRSAKFYIRELLRLVTFGGPIILLLIIFGAIDLRKRKPRLLKLFYLWIPVWFIILIFIKSSNWDHLLEIWIPIILLASLGTKHLAQIIKDNLKLEKTKLTIVLSLAAIFLAGHMVIACKWMFHEEYNTSNPEEYINISQSINRAGLTNSDVVALDVLYLSTVSFYTNQTLIKFTPQTIQKLIDSGKLKEAFEKFKVTHVVGYKDELNSQIREQTEVVVIKR